jgi:hypothetical protein
MTHTTANVYGLAGPDGVIKYVGQTVRSVKGRLQSHAFYARRGDKTPVCAWIREVGVDNVTPVQLEVCAHADRYDRERHWINELKTSVPDGGCNWFVRGAMPEHFRAVLARNAALAGAANKGRTLSDEHKAKLRESQPAIQQAIADRLKAGAYDRAWYERRGRTPPASRAT